MQENRHSIFIKATAFEVFPQILLWGEATWWPKDSQMKFTRITPGELAVGTRYLQKVSLPFGPKWEAEISAIEPNKRVSRRFLNGIFSGSEWVEVEPTAIGCKVNYVMSYEINGALNKILWLSLFCRMHDRNIRLILNSLKNFVLDNKD